MPRTRFPVFALLACLGVCLLGGTACRAENYALLIGIDQYQQNDAINGLAGASNDAKGLAGALQQVSGFPADHVRVLTSDADPRPTGANITFELDQLSGRAKPGDLVFVLFSGHGIEMDGKTYLVPWDADARTESTLRRTSLPETDVRAQLSQISARGLIMAFDMCRSDPRKGSKAVQQDNLMGRQAKDLRVVPVTAGADAPGPRAVVTLFSCSQGERSWEWRDKGRGFFSFYLEQGLRRDAADSKGVVRAGTLVTYLERAVAGAVKREQGHDQRPYSIVEGTGAQDLVLAQGRTGGAGAVTPSVAVLTPLNTGDALKGRFDAVLRQGRALLKSHQWEDALGKFSAARELQPSSALALEGLGEANARLRRFDESERQYRRALEIDPRLASAVRGLAELAFNKHQNAEAERLIRQAIALDPQDSNSLGDLGMLHLLVKHDNAEAERTFLKAQTLDPSNADVMVGLGLVAFKKGNGAQAEALYRKALKADPKSALAFEGLGLLADQRGDGAKAEQHLRQAMALDPADSDAVSYLAGITLKYKKDAAGAERLYRKAMTMDPTSATPTLGLAMVYMVKQDFDEAERLAHSGNELDPKDPEGIALLGVFALRRRDFDAAIPLFRQALALDDSKGEYHALYATCLLVQGDETGARAEAKRAIALGDKGPYEVYDALGLKP